MEPRLEQAKTFLLEKGFDLDKVNDLFSCWQEPHRHYHNLDHLMSLLLSIDKMDWCSEEDRECLFLIALYHDSVYDPTWVGKKHAFLANRVNEFLSTKKFSIDSYETKISSTVRSVVVSAILDTGKRTPNPECKISSAFWELDNDILSRPLDDLLEYEQRISKEFQFSNWNSYVEGRSAFLEDEKSRYPKNAENIEALIQYIKTKKPSIGIYVGSFNPFHVGHLDILTKADRIFDKVILVQGKNPTKNSDLVPLPKSLRFFEQVQWEGLTTEFIKEVQSYAKVTLIRGIRDEKDLHAETIQLRFMEDILPEINIVYIPCSHKTSFVSSSAIRHLEKFSPSDAKKYLIS